MRIRGLGLARRMADRLGMRRPGVVHLARDGAPIRNPRALQHFPAATLPPGATLWDWPAHLSPDARPWLASLRRLYEHPLSYPTSLSPQAGLLLHALTLNLRPARCVETGSNIGISALWIAGALEECGAGSLTCLDNFEPIHRPGVSHISGQQRRAVLNGALRDSEIGPRVRVIPGNSPDLLRTHARDIGPLQLAFLDGDHGFDGVLADFLAVEPMLDTGGLVVLHDTFPIMCAWDGPRRLLNTLHQHARGTYQVTDLYLAPVNYGLAVARRIA